MEATAGQADVQVSEITLLPAVYPTIPTAAALLDRQEQGQSESHGRQPALFGTAVCGCQVSACLHPSTAQNGPLLLQ